MMNTTEVPSISEVGRIVEAQGFFVLSQHLPVEWQDCLAARLKYLAIKLPGQKNLLPDPVFVKFATAPFMRALATELLGTDAVVHHVNGRILNQGVEKSWHHDRDGNLPRSEAGMYHVMVYPRGLPWTVAPLVVMPGTHLRAVRRDAPQELVSIDSSIEAVAIRDEKPLIVVLDSALWHMRPAEPSLVPRFDLNVSYCTPGDCWSERRNYTTILQQSAALSSLPRWFRTA